jgi:hypothetical protein
LNSFLYFVIVTYMPIYIWVNNSYFLFEFRNSTIHVIRFIRKMILVTVFIHEDQSLLHEVRNYLFQNHWIQDSHNSLSASVIRSRDLRLVMM